MKDVDVKLENAVESVGEGGWRLKERICEVRGRRVMLDYDLAEIYGYTTKAFNQQVQRNKEKFVGEDFMFRLTRGELDHFVRSHFVTSRNDLFSGQNGGSRYLPYAFTEQGIYMLMTVLRGPLAVKQSRALVMAFKALKDYVVEERQCIVVGHRRRMRGGGSRW